MDNLQKSNIMKKLFLQPLIKGSIVVLPLLVTVWFLWSALFWLNTLGTDLIVLLHLPSLFPGMGLLLMLVGLLVVGLLFQFNPVSWLYQYLEDVLLRFPLVKTLYGAVKDFANMFDQTEERDQQVVLIDIPPLGKAVGFITSKQAPQSLQGALGDQNLVAVYMPMSYMIGGYTVFIPPERITVVDWSFEDAMRFTLTAGVSQTEARKSNN